MKTGSAAVIQFFILLQILSAAVAVDVLAGNARGPGTMTYGQKLTSARNIFELSFFSTFDSAHTYLGIRQIRHRNDPKVVVWVANRNASLTSSVAALNLTADGNLVLYDNATGSIVWSAATSNCKKPLLQLHDSGNLVLTDLENNSTLWQSFHSPCDTFLIGMKLGVLNLQSKKIMMRLVSWKNADDPFLGGYSYELEGDGIPEFYLRGGAQKLYRSGPWTGGTFSGYPDMLKTSSMNCQFVSNQSGVYFTVEAPDDSTPVIREVVSDSGKFERWAWIPDKEAWRSVWSLPKDECDQYAACGPNGVCSVRYSTFNCSCPEGFAPAANNGSGCERKMSLGCSTDTFRLLKNVKLPDTTNATADRSRKTLDQCTDWCWRNCSCVAYAMVGPYGCVAWTGDLWDLRSFSESGGDEIYLRLSHSELGSSPSISSSNKLALVTAIPLVLGFLLMFCLGLLVWNKIRTKPDPDAFDEKWRTNISKNTQTNDNGAGLSTTLHAFDLSTISAATNNFSDDHKLGEGGFGVVYKGELQDGQKLAVKKLSGGSSQRPDEFRTELTVIANLQHRNLVRLLGYCIEGGERILILEYMENKSLDAFIYDKTKSILLNWQKRLDIVLGIARGLLYLHQDSNLRVIHRDLKPSNILLDKDMNPKISDFGIAKTFEGDGFHEDATRRPIGTFGYMAPEYLTRGIFSLKSDVFSFGVIVLEILSGRRNRVFNQAGTQLNLLGHAFKLWEEGRPLEILDDALDCTYSSAEILRCIQMGLLCVQASSDCRPTMAEVVMILTSEDQMLTPLNEPIIRSTTAVNGETDYSSCKDISVTITGR